MKSISRATDTIARELVAEQGRWALWIPVLLGIGVILYFSLPNEPSLWFGPLAGLILLFVGYWLHQHEYPLTLVIITALPATGVVLAQLRTALVATPMLETRLEAEVEGQVLAIDTSTSTAPRILLRVTYIKGLPADTQPQQVRIRLNQGIDAPDPGAFIRLPATLLPLPIPAEPGAHDFARQYFFDRIGATGSSMGPLTLVPGPAPGPIDELLIFFERLRRQLASRILDIVPGPAGQVITAYLNGDQTQIDSQTLGWFRASGLAHLLSVSGLHISLVAGGVFFFVRAMLALVPWLALRWPIKKLAALVAMLAATFYTVLVGAPVPTLRSVAMVAVVLLAVLTDRDAISLRTLAVAATGIIALIPESLPGASFQMSFAAVLCLIAAHELMAGPLAALRATLGFAWRLLLSGAVLCGTSLVATLATTPFSLYHFQQAATYGVAANMLAVPLTSVWVMPLGVISILLMPFNLDAIPLTLMGWGTWLTVEIAQAFALLPGAVWHLPAPTVGFLLFTTFGLLWLTLWRRPWRLLGLLPLTLSLALLIHPHRPDILVGDGARIIGVRDSSTGTRWFTPTSGSSFQIATWRRRDGDDPMTPTPRWTSAGQAKGAAYFPCTVGACIMGPPGQKVAILSDRRRFSALCQQAAIIIMERPPTDCPGKRMIDQASILREGAHALSFTNSQVIVETVAQVRGNRPWSRRPVPTP